MIRREFLGQGRIQELEALKDADPLDLTQGVRKWVCQDQTNRVDPARLKEADEILWGVRPDYALWRIFTYSLLRSHLIGNPKNDANALALRAGQIARSLYASLTSADIRIRYSGLAFLSCLDQRDTRDILNCGVPSDYRPRNTAPGYSQLLKLASAIDTARDSNHPQSPEEAAIDLGSLNARLLIRETLSDPSDLPYLQAAELDDIYKLVHQRLTVISPGVLRSKGHLGAVTFDEIKRSRSISTGAQCIPWPVMQWGVLIPRVLSNLSAQTWEVRIDEATNKLLAGRLISTALELAQAAWLTWRETRTGYLEWLNEQRQLAEDSQRLIDKGRQTAAKARTGLSYAGVDLHERALLPHESRLLADLSLREFEAGNPFRAGAYACIALHAAATANLNLRNPGRKSAEWPLAASSQRSLEALCDALGLARPKGLTQQDTWRRKRSGFEGLRWSYLASYFREDEQAKILTDRVRKVHPFASHAIPAMVAGRLPLGETDARMARVELAIRYAMPGIAFKTALDGDKHHYLSLSKESLWKLFLHLAQTQWKLLPFSDATSIGETRTVGLEWWRTSGARRLFKLYCASRTTESETELPLELLFHESQAGMLCGILARSANPRPLYALSYGWAHGELEHSQKPFDLLDSVADMVRYGIEGAECPDWNQLPTDVSRQLAKNDVFISLMTREGHEVHIIAIGTNGARKSWVFQTAQHGIPTDWHLLKARAVDGPLDLSSNDPCEWIVWPSEFEELAVDILEKARILNGRSDPSRLFISGSYMFTTVPWQHLFASRLKLFNVFISVVPGANWLAHNRRVPEPASTPHETLLDGNSFPQLVDDLEANARVRLTRKSNKFPVSSLFALGHGARELFRATLTLGEQLSKFPPKDLVVLHHCWAARSERSRAGEPAGWPGYFIATGGTLVLASSIEPPVHVITSIDKAITKWLVDTNDARSFEEFYLQTLRADPSLSIYSCHGIPPRSVRRPTLSSDVAYCEPVS